MHVRNVLRQRWFFNFGDGQPGYAQTHVLPSTIDQPQSVYQSAASWVGTLLQFLNPIPSATLPEESTRSVVICSSNEPRGKSALRTMCFLFWRDTANMRTQNHN